MGTNKAAGAQCQTAGGLFDDVPQGLPAFNRAAKLQKRASKIGLDWPDASGPLEKMHEELAELQQAMAPGDSSASEADILAEVGDLLFAVVNFCRKQSLSPEQALRLANRKFTRRVESIQAELEKLYEGQAETG